MKKQGKQLLLLILIVLVLVGAMALLLKPQTLESTPQTKTILISKQPEELQNITIKNSHDHYQVTFGDDGLVFHDLPLEQLNLEYLSMLIDESTYIEAESHIADAEKRLGDFGLSNPVATVIINYADGSSAKLELGNHEPISNGRYILFDKKVYLLRESRTIRFTMPVEKYLQYIIVPPEYSPSTLSTLGDISIAGTSMSTPIVLHAVSPDNSSEQLQALSFGSVTHLLQGDVLREVNPTALLTLADGILGLISEGIVAYNCTEDDLQAYQLGNSNAWLDIKFDYQLAENAPFTPYRLRFAPYENGYIVTANDLGIIYKTVTLPLLTQTADDYVLRWYFSPFIRDIKAVELNIGMEKYLFNLTHGDTLLVECNGESISESDFRKFYTLLLSAADDGTSTKVSPSVETSILTICYQYQNPQKNDDVLTLYPHSPRKVIVDINSTAYSTMRMQYVTTVSDALYALLKSQPFQTEW